MPSRALVLFSGGQDSTTCLAHALTRYAHVETVAFDYGQRHRIELDARLRVREEIVRSFPAWARTPVCQIDARSMPGESVSAGDARRALKRDAACCV